MQLALTEEETAFREEMRTFFTTKIPQEIRDTIAAGGHVGKEGIVESQRILNEAGLAVPNWPVEWGGQDWTPLQRHIWHEEMQLACVPPPLAFNANMVGPVIANFGSQEQKEKFLPATANLDIWWCQGFSEPDAGSDLASLKTKAVRDGDDWVINGQKTWTTLGQYADWIFVLCRTDPDAPKKQQGISFILVPDGRRGRHPAPDPADRRRLRGQRGLLRGRPRPGREPGRRGERGLELWRSSCSATSASGSPRSAPPSACSPRPRRSPRNRPARGPARRGADRSSWRTSCSPSS